MFTIVKYAFSIALLAGTTVAVHAVEPTYVPRVSVSPSGALITETIENPRCDAIHQKRAEAWAQVTPYGGDLQKMLGVAVLKSFPWVSQPYQSPESEEATLKIVRRSYSPSKQKLLVIVGETIPGSNKSIPHRGFFIIDRNGLTNHIVWQKNKWHASRIGSVHWVNNTTIRYSEVDPAGKTLKTLTYKLN